MHWCLKKSPANTNQIRENSNDTRSWAHIQRYLVLVTLYYRRHRADVIHVFRIITRIDCIEMCDFFVYDVVVNRGNDRKLLKPRASTSKKQHCFSHQVINDWNDLPNYVVFSESLNSFKSNLNKYWYNTIFKFEF